MALHLTISGLAQSRCLLLLAGPYRMCCTRRVQSRAPFQDVALLLASLFPPPPPAPRNHPHHIYTCAQHAVTTCGDFCAIRTAQTRFCRRRKTSVRGGKNCSVAVLNVSRSTRSHPGMIFFFFFVRSFVGLEASFIGCFRRSIISCLPGKLHNCCFQDLTQVISGPEQVEHSAQAHTHLKKYPYGVRLGCL